MLAVFAGDKDLPSRVNLILQCEISGSVSRNALKLQLLSRARNGNNHLPRKLQVNRVSSLGGLLDVS